MNDLQAQIVEMVARGLSYADIGIQLGGLSRDVIRRQFRNLPDDIKLAARAAANQPENTPPQFTGATLATELPPDTASAWEYVVARQQKRFAREAEKSRRAITINPPCGLALLSDTHIGNPGTDYEAIYQDAQVIQQSPGLFCAFNGDGIDNWIIGKLQGKQRGQVVDLDTEWQLFFDWLDMLRGSLLFVVAGNHDNWTLKLAGWDRVREHLRDAHIFYDAHEVRFVLNVGPASYRIKARHKWKGSSVFNPTHGLEVGLKRGGHDFDIAIGGHTHIGTLMREFIYHGRRRWAILLGTYKLIDDFQTEVGFAPSHGRGSGALVFDEAGRLQFFDELEIAADYLRWLREK